MPRARWPRSRCGQVARSLSAVIVDAEDGAELPDAHVGEIWLHGDDVTAGYWGRPDETRHAFGARLRSRLDHDSHAGAARPTAPGCAPAILGFYLDGELYVTGARWT